MTTLPESIDYCRSIIYRSIPAGLHSTCIGTRTWVTRFSDGTGNCQTCNQKKTTPEFHLGVMGCEAGCTNVYDAGDRISDANYTQQALSQPRIAGESGDLTFDEKA